MTIAYGSNLPSVHRAQGRGWIVMGIVARLLQNISYITQCFMASGFSTKRIALNERKGHDDKS